jgi:prepilin signal peptidase PulO-like enzyme (type II secretory pathway)
MNAESILSGALLVYGFAMGICLGSFATALIWRIPRNLPWIYNKKDKKAVRSICPSCGATLGVADLFPVFSWLCLKGKCRHCHARISGVYPLTEIVWGCVGMAVFTMLGTSLYSVLVLFILLFAWIYVWVGIRSAYWSRSIFAILTILVIGLGMVCYFDDTAPFNNIYPFTGF